jgi:hypothetical protein
MALKKENGTEKIARYRHEFYPKTFGKRIRRKIGRLNLKKGWFAWPRESIDPSISAVGKFRQPSDKY